MRKMATVTATREEAIRRYREVQDIAISAAIKAVENAKKRRDEINRLWNDYGQELKKTVQDRVIESLGEKNEGKYQKYLTAKKQPQPSARIITSEYDVSNVVAEESGIDELLKAMRRDETTEGRAIKAEAELVKEELKELEKILTILRNSKGRLLTVEELEELQVLIHNASATLAREVSADIFLKNVNAEESKLAEKIKSLAHNISRLEWTEGKRAKAR